jgi:hypothetical protein
MYMCEARYIKFTGEYKTVSIWEQGAEESIWA